jgi:Glycosyl hydrolase family 26
MVEESVVPATRPRRRCAPVQHRYSLVRRSVAAVAVAAATIALTTGAAVASPARAEPRQPALTHGPIVFGASGGAEVAKLAKKIGAPLAAHVFGRLQGPVLTGRLINMQPGVTWQQVASARPGSRVYADIARWADTLKRRSGPHILFTFSHEPEGDSSRRLGNATQFKAAFRHVHDIFQARGVRNVEYTWNVTSNSFRVPKSDPRYAAKWYPGNAYVDNVASAAYNWYNCGEGHGKWLSLQNRAAGPLAFAKAHGKPYVLAEWASQQGPLRAQWLNQARSWFLANKRYIRGAFYYQTPTPRTGCSWRLQSPADLQAFARMARDRADFGG